ENTVYLRIDLFNGLGWSAHDHSVGCWCPWPEGDYATGREVPIILTGNPAIDPQTVKPDDVMGIWKIDDPGSYVKQELWEDPAGTQVMGDPLPLVIISKQWSLGGAGPFGKAIARMGMVRYTRAADPFDLLVLVDSRINKVIRCPA